MSERRYTEEEMAAIFERASKVEPGGAHQLQRREGMTLGELQAIGREAGIPAEHVAAAARDVAIAAQPGPSTLMGLPIGVARTVVLERRLDDEAWERLVVDLRETFRARGSVRVDGSLRQWTNGNLQVLVEPWGDGQRVRMRTRNANAQALVVSGGVLLAFTGVIGAIAAVGDMLLVARTLLGLGTLAALSGGVFAAGAFRLPGWARERQDQMDAIAERLLQG